MNEKDRYLQEQNMMKKKIKKKQEKEELID
jgi:hypothetical protein